MADDIQEPEILYLHDDHIGSVESITDADGALVERRAYDPFGNRQNPNNRGRPLPTPTPSAISLGFTSHRHDDDLGLIDMHARVYDPGDGHFLSDDPVVPNVADGRMWNRYAYAMNNPTTLTDPTGLQTNGKGETKGDRVVGSRQKPRLWASMSILRGNRPNHRVCLVTVSI
jgi:RHS repeat-associated protein